MKNNFLFVSITLGFVQAGIAWLVARWLDAMLGQIMLPNSADWILEAGLAGLVFAICSLARIDLRARQFNLIISTTLSFAVLLIPLLIWLPEISARVLVLFYTLALVTDVVVWRVLRTRKHVGYLQSERLIAYLDSMPHAIFLIAALCLIALVPFMLAIEQSFIAERIARWGLGFLMLGVAGTALAKIELPVRFKSWENRALDIVFGLLIVILVVIALQIEQVSRPSPAVIFYTDIQPNILESRVKDGDVIVSASSNLRLDGIRNVGAHLDLDPNANRTALWNELARAFNDKRRVFWVSVPSESSDAEKVVATFLQTNGCLTEVVNQKLSVRAYELRTPFTPLNNLTPLTVDWQNIQLTGVAFAKHVCSGDAVAISTRWQLSQPSNTPLKASWFVIDNKGRRIQSQDFFLADSAQRQTNQWITGNTVIAEYLLPIPFGTPPGDYSLGVAIYPATNPQRSRIINSNGIAEAFPDFAALAAFQVYRADDLTGDPYKTIPELALLPARVELHDGLQLDAYSIDRIDVMPGEEVSAIVRWQALHDELPKSQMRARLVRDNQTIVETVRTPVDDNYPTDRWRAHEFVLDRFELRVPPTAPGGTTRFEIGIVGGRTLYLADINIAQVEHTFEPPKQFCSTRATFAGVGELIGCEMPAGSIASQNSLTTTLYWRAIAKPAIDRNYVVFVQLVAADGHLIAQSDAMPAQGQRPTRGWVDNEIIRDQHVLEWRDPNYRGAAKWIIGMYDPATLERLPALGSDASVVDFADVQIVAR